MKNLSQKIKKTYVTVMLVLMNGMCAYATVSDGTAQFDNIMNWLSGWIGKIGIILTLWGGIQIAFSVSNEDAGQKRKGILEAVSGLMVMALAYGYRAIIGI